MTRKPLNKNYLSNLTFRGFSPILSLKVLQMYRSDAGTEEEVIKELELEKVRPQHLDTLTDAYNHHLCCFDHLQSVEGKVVKEIKPDVYEVVYCGGRESSVIQMYFMFPDVRGIISFPRIVHSVGNDSPDRKSPIGVYTEKGLIGENLEILIGKLTEGILTSEKWHKENYQREYEKGQTVEYPPLMN